MDVQFQTDQLTESWGNNEVTDERTDRRGRREVILTKMLVPLSISPQYSLLFSDETGYVEGSPGWRGVGRVCVYQHSYMDQRLTFRI